MNLLPENCKRRPMCQAEGCAAEVVCHPHAVDPTARLPASWRQLMQWLCARRLSWSPPFCRGHSGHATPFKHPGFHLCLKLEEEMLLITLPSLFAKLELKSPLGTIPLERILVFPGFTSNPFQNPTYLL